MIEIKDLLSGFEHILLKEENKSIYVKQAIFEATGISVPKESIQIKNGTIYLKIKPIYKNEIFLNQDLILENLQKSLTSKGPSKIQ